METRWQKEFTKIIRGLCHGHQLWRVFSDFCEMAALTLANGIVKDPAREERYIKLMAAYSPAEQKQICHLFACVQMGIEETVDCDFLGELFMGLELSSHWHGQYFSPMALCQLMAEMSLDDSCTEEIAEHGFVSINEPAAGAGAMIIAFAQAMRRKLINPQERLWVVCIDKDPTAAHMAFIQLALHGLPAQVIVGDTLRMQFTEAFLTPVYWLGMWGPKVRRGYTLDSRRGRALNQTGDVLPATSPTVNPPESKLTATPEQPETQPSAPEILSTPLLTPRSRQLSLF